MSADLFPLPPTKEVPAASPTKAIRATALLTGEPLLWELPVAAAMLSVSERTLKRMDAAGELPKGAVVRLGRRRLFVRKVLEDWVRRGCERPVHRSRTR
jgi:hypothetical protein